MHPDSKMSDNVVLSAFSVKKILFKLVLLQLNQLNFFQPTHELWLQASPFQIELVEDQSRTDGIFFRLRIKVKKLELHDKIIVQWYC